MPQPTSRQEFIDYTMRKLGAPVIEINVSEEQVEDRVDEAISYWRDYHYNGSQLVYLKHQITQADKDNGYITLPRVCLVFQRCSTYHRQYLPVLECSMYNINLY